jgi:hypothetical protein
MTKLLAIFAVLTACGSKAPPTATPAEAPPSAPAAGSATMAEPATPAAPAPTEPAAPDPAKAKADAVATEDAAYEKAKPVFEKYCANCHTKAGKKATAKKLDHFDMGMYPFGGEHTKSIGNEIRKVLGIDGGKPTMPYDKPGSVTGDDLAAIKAWTEAWQAAGKAGVHPAEPADND